MAFTTLEAITTDGVRLAIDRVAAIGPRRGVVLCLHAMMTDGRYFGARRDNGFAAALANAGLDVFVLDFRGHGNSTPPTARTANWTFDDLVRFDLPAAVNAVARVAGAAVSEVTLLGHSLGGMVAAAGVATKTIATPAQIVLAAVGIWLPGPHGDRKRRAIMTMYRLSARLLGYAPIRFFRLGTADEAGAYVEQLTRWARTGAWTSNDGVDYFAALATETVRTWGFLGDGDPLCTLEDARSMLESESIVRVGRAHGDAIDPDHFTLFTERKLAPRWTMLAETMLKARR